MKKIVCILAVLSLLAPDFAFAASLPVPAQELPNENLLVNPGFENGVYGWTASGGATKTVNTTAAGMGKYGYDWDSNAAAQTLISNSITIPNALKGKNGLAYCSFATPSGAATHTITVDDGTNNLATPVTITSLATFTPVPVNFIFPSSGSVRLKISSVASNEPEIYVDKCYLGEALNFSNATPITAWSSQYSFTPNNFGSVTSPTYQSRQVGDTLEVIGNFTAGTTAAAIASLSFPASLSIDSTKISSASMGTAVGFCTQTAGSGSVFGSESFVIFYDGSDTSKLYFSITTGTSAYSKANANSVASSSAGVQCSFKVPVVQFASSVPIASLANVSANWGATSNIIGSNSATGSAADITGSLAGGFTVVGTPHGISCSAATGQLGVTCTLPKIGNYEIKYSGTVSSATAGAGEYSQLTDGSNNALTGIQLVTIPGASYSTSIGGDASYTATSVASAITFKLRGYNSTGTGTWGFTSFTITQTDAPGPQPYATGNVSSTTTGQEHLERATFAGNSTDTANCTSTPCAIVTQTGAWVSSVTRVSTGTYTLNVAAGEFSSTPTCTANNDQQGVMMVRYDWANSTSTALKFFTYNSSFALGDTSVHVICMGPH